LNHLPAPFIERMRLMLGPEFDAFIASYENARTVGLRVNTLKVPVSRFLQLAPFALEPIPWADAGFYYDEQERPGRHPYHAAGLYYIQEPSAMAVVPILGPRPGEKVLDLAAAPGGKATQIASFMDEKGLLVANEIHPARAKILSENIERCGIKNAIVTNETPSRLAGRFPEFFDRILLDAPCSGEGMFRKDETACSEWSESAPAACAARQWEIIPAAEQMLRPGGLLAYSTCTFAPGENEELIGRFTETYPHMKPVPLAARHGFVNSGGGALRIWPHRVRGEGHFIALLQKTGDPRQFVEKKRRWIKQGVPVGEYIKFADQYLNIVPDGRFALFGDHLYIQPPETPDLKGMKVIRPGLHLGVLQRNRFEPSHALALALKAGDVKRKADYKADAAEVRQYLRGETLPRRGEKGWTLITVDGFSLGWAKQSDGMLKNHYPKGLRRL
jgi:NOL1/NOP2/sun family putative RNA methylase